MKKDNSIFDHLKVRKIDSPDKTYFEGLASEIIAQNKEKTLRPIYKRTFIWVSSAAAILAVIFMSKLFSSNQSTIQFAFEDISTNEAKVYVENNIEEFDIELMAEYISPEEIVVQRANQEQAIKEEAISLHLEDFSREEILEYIENEDISIDDNDEFYF